MQISFIQCCSISLSSTKQHTYLIAPFSYIRILPGLNVEINFCTVTERTLWSGPLRSKWAVYGQQCKKNLTPLVQSYIHCEVDFQLGGEYNVISQYFSIRIILENLHLQHRNTGNQTGRNNQSFVPIGKKNSCLMQLNFNKLI